MIIIENKNFEDEVTIKKASDKDVRNWINDHPLGWNPKTNIIFVDAETFGRCCQAIFKWRSLHPQYTEIATGINNGLMFKGFELVLDDEK